MRRTDTCELSYDADTARTTGTSTYEQLEYAQELKRKHLNREGVLFALYGVTGLGVVAVAGSRKPAP